MLTQEQVTKAVGIFVRLALGALAGWFVRVGYTADAATIEIVAGILVPFLAAFVWGWITRTKLLNTEPPGRE